MDLPLRICTLGQTDAPTPHLSVDGMSPTGPNLSHWPGNRTPARWKADLSTGICLAFAKADAAERAAFLDGAEAIVNDHYDTDGFLSMLAVLRPNVALPREDLCLMAAATGDYQMLFTDRGFAIDRIVYGLRRSPASPICAELAGMSPADADQRCYAWLIDNAEAVLDEPERFAALWRDELTAMRASLTAARAGAIEHQLHANVGTAVITAEQPVPRMVLNTLARAWRVLHVEVTEDGPLYRYHDRTESWFEVVTFAPPRRRDMRPLAERLATLEGTHSDSVAAWTADAPDVPVPELYFGVPSEQAYGELTRVRVLSRLDPELVVCCLVEFLEESS